MKAVRIQRINPWQQAEMLERAVMGASSLELAKKYGLHRATVNRLIARYGTEARRQLKAKERVGVI